MKSIHLTPPPPQNKNKNYNTKNQQQQQQTNKLTNKELKISQRVPTR